MVERRSVPAVAAFSTTMSSAKIPLTAPGCSVARSTVKQGEGRSRRAFRPLSSSISTSISTPDIRRRIQNLDLDHRSRNRVGTRDLSRGHGRAGGQPQVGGGKAGFRQARTARYGRRHRRREPLKRAPRSADPSTTHERPSTARQSTTRQSKARQKGIQMGRKVAIVGAALSDCGRVDDKTAYQLHHQATTRALADAGISRTRSTASCRTGRGTCRRSSSPRYIGVALARQVHRLDRRGGIVLGDVPRARRGCDIARARSRRCSCRTVPPRALT